MVKPLKPKIYTKICFFPSNSISLKKIVGTTFFLKRQNLYLPIGYSQYFSSKGNKTMQNKL